MGHGLLFQWRQLLSICLKRGARQTGRRVRAGFGLKPVAGNFRLGCFKGSCHCFSECVHMCRAVGKVLCVCAGDDCHRSPRGTHGAVDV